jgi:hypothetical protein
MNPYLLYFLVGLTTSIILVILVQVLGRLIYFIAYKLGYITDSDYVSNGAKPVVGMAILTVLGVICLFMMLMGRVILVLLFHMR